MATRDELLGTDILFTDDLQVTASGDYVEVSGEENLRRAIYRRLLTRPGEFEVRPGYGIGLQSYVKRPMTPTLLAELRQRIVDQLSADPRVEGVTEVLVEKTVTGDRPILRVAVRVKAAGQERALRPFEFTEEQ